MNSFTLRFAFSFAVLAVVGLGFTPTRAQADDKTPSEYLAEGWNHYIYYPFLDKLSEIDRVPAANAQDQATCDHFYQHVNSTNEIKIVMGVGYYDSSEGEPFSFDYRDSHGLEHADFGMNATVDPTYEYLYRDVLTQKCHGSLELCGFSEGPTGVYSKYVTSPKGQRVHAVIEIRNSSVTPQNDQNIGPLKDQQLAKSQATTQWFFSSMATSDLVIYNGHSRKGGGPDFSPPRLLSNLHVDYDWYQNNQPGLHRLLAGLQAATTKPAALMMMSCNSYPLFNRAIAKVAPGVSYAGTNAIIPGDIPNRAAMAGMDAFLKFQCQDGFTKQLHSMDDLTQQIHPLTMH